MDKVQEVVDELGLVGDFDGNIFVAEFKDSDSFSNAYTTISDKYEAEDSGNQFDDATSVTVFSTDEIEIIASANYDTDNYAISVGVK